MSFRADIRRRFDEPGSISASALPSSLDADHPKYSKNQWWAYWSWAVVSFSIFGLLVANAVFWFIGSGAAHDCGDVPPLPTAVLTQHEYDSCVLKNDSICQDWRSNEATGFIAILFAVVFATNSYLFHFRCFSPTNPNCYQKLSGAFREHFSSAATRNGVLNTILILGHVAFFISLAVADHPNKITMRRCGNREAIAIGAISFATVFLLFLHVLCVWWYTVNAAPRDFSSSALQPVVIEGPAYGGAQAQNLDYAYAEQPAAKPQAPLGPDTITVFSRSPEEGTSFMVPPQYR